MAEDLFKFRRFRFELEGLTQGAFAAMDPPGEQVPVVVEEGRARRAEEPGFRTHARLFDGVANTRELSVWLGRSLSGTPEPRDVGLVELDDDGRPVARHLFAGAWPVRLRLATLSGDQLFSVEELELAVERWTWSAAADEDERILPSPARRVR